MKAGESCGRMADRLRPAGGAVLRAAVPAKGGQGAREERKAGDTARGNAGKEKGGDKGNVARGKEENPKMSQTSLNPRGGLCYNEMKIAAGYFHQPCGLSSGRGESK